MELSDSQNIEKVISHFETQGDPGPGTATGSGLINDTYHIKNLISGYPDYLLQKINHQIFENVPALMENIVLVTSHLREKLIANNEAEIEHKVLTPVPAKTTRAKQLYYYKDGQGNYWRVYIFIPSVKSYNLVETKKQAFEGAKAFGRFQAMLADLDASLITEVIPGFHHIGKRLNDFYSSIKNDAMGRVKDLAEEIDFLKSRSEEMSRILQLGESGLLPLRINHSDTKFNNVLLDENDEAQCVIDLDTVMPGYVAYDFGDAIRSIINTAVEDEADLEKIQLDIPLFRAYTSGYVSATHSFLTAEEIHSLMKGVMLLPYMQSVRFLGDYIDGDRYYKTDFPGHNLQRARAQIQLVKKLEENYDLLEKIVFEEAAIYLPHFHISDPSVRKVWK